MHFSRIIGAALACLALNAFAQDQPAPATETNSMPPELKDARKTRVLTMDEAIQMALTHNFDIQITRFTPLIDTYLHLNTDYAAYEPALEFGINHSFSARPTGFNATSGLPQPASQINVDSYSGDLAGTLPTGLTYDFNGINRPLTRETGNTVDPGSEWQAGPSIILKQPILKNFWTDKTRFQISLDKNLVRSDELSLQLKIMSVVTSVKTAYFNLIAARENVKVNVKALELADKLVTENRERVRVGALAPLDEKQSESQAATSRANLLASEQALNTAENNFKNLITDSFTDWVDVTPIPSETLVVVPAELNLQESWRKGVTLRPEMQLAKLTVDNQHITVRYQFNQLFPEVDLSGSYGHNAVDPSLTPVLGDLRDGKYPSYSYGVTVTIPLGDTAPRNQIKAAKANLKQALLQLKQEEQTIVVAIDNDVKIIRSDLQQVDATREARIYAEAALDAEQKKLENGKSTSFVVLQLQSNLTSARSAEIAAQANYNIALEQLALDEGTTLERNHIDLKKK